MPKRYTYVHEAVAAAVRRKYPALSVESTYSPGDVDSWKLDIKGGTKAERDEAVDFAKRYAEGYLYKPPKK